MHAAEFLTFSSDIRNHWITPIRINIEPELKRDRISKLIKLTDNTVNNLSITETEEDPNVRVIVDNDLRPFGQAEIFANGRGEVGSAIVRINIEAIRAWAHDRFETTLINIIIHELGHVYGLGHSEGTAHMRRTTPLMNSSPQIDNTKMDFDYTQALKELYDNKHKQRAYETDCDTGYFVFRNKEQKQKEFSRGFENSLTLLVPFKNRKAWRFKTYCR